MNIHVPEEIRSKWSQYEFIGEPFSLANGKKYMRAKRKHWLWEGHNHIYCFQEDFFWHETTVQEILSVK